MKKAIAIDGNSLFYRMYYATKNQLDFAIKNNWTPNNGIKLMLSTVNKLITNNDYDYVFIAFDAGKKTFRHDLMNTYKSGRSETPDELIKQMNDTILMLKALGICVMSKEGVEADDLIGSFVKKMNCNDIFCDVFSSDKDLLQLVNEKCNVKLLKTGISNIDEYNINNFSEKFYGLKPYQVIEYKAIIGDKSDRLQGVNGIGEKTGVELLLKYETIDNIYNNLEDLSIKNKEKFVISKESAMICKKMATILVNQFDDVEIELFKISDKKNDIIEELINKYNLSKLFFLKESK